MQSHPFRALFPNPSMKPHAFLIAYLHDVRATMVRVDPVQHLSTGRLHAPAILQPAPEIQQDAAR